MEAGSLTQVFVANPLFANLFDRESGFNDAFVVVHAGLRFGKIWNYAKMKIIAQFQIFEKQKFSICAAWIR